MKKTTTKKLNMYINVQSVMSDYQPAWQNASAFVAIMANFSSKLDLLKIRLVQQSSLTTGVAVDKQLQLIKLRKQMLIAQRALLVHGRATGNVALQERNKKIKSSIIELSVNELAVRGAELKLDLEQYGSQLSDYGITPGFITVLIPLLQSIDDVNNSTRRAIIDRTQVTESINNLERALDELIQIDLDGLMLVFEDDQPAFYNVYRKARMIINFHNGHGAKPPVEPDDGRLAS